MEKRGKPCLCLPCGCGRPVWWGREGNHHCAYLVVVVGLFGGEEGGQQRLDVLLDGHG